MAKCDDAQRALCKSLGKKYRIVTIDFEPVIYRDFGNGFNVELSFTHTTSKRKPALAYLWFGDGPGCLVVRTLRVPRKSIGAAVEELLAYSEDLIRRGLNNSDSLSLLADTTPRAFEDTGT